MTFYEENKTKQNNLRPFEALLPSGGNNINLQATKNFSLCLLIVSNFLKFNNDFNLGMSLLLSIMASILETYVLQF